jgi:hypothetical protein
MKLVATGLLVAMAAVFLLARWMQDTHAAWGFVRAFAEAAMVGGLADWFAVTLPGSSSRTSWYPTWSRGGCNAWTWRARPGAGWPTPPAGRSG